MTKAEGLVYGKKNTVDMNNISVINTVFVILKQRRPHARSKSFSRNGSVTLFYYVMDVKK